MAAAIERPDAFRGMQTTPSTECRRNAGGNVPTAWRVPLIAVNAPTNCGNLPGNAGALHHNGIDRRIHARGEQVGARGDGVGHGQEVVLGEHEPQALAEQP